MTNFVSSYSGRRSFKIYFDDIRICFHYCWHNRINECWYTPVSDKMTGKTNRRLLYNQFSFKFLHSYFSYLIITPCRLAFFSFLFCCYFLSIFFINAITAIHCCCFHLVFDIEKILFSNRRPLFCDEFIITRRC